MKSSSPERSFAKRVRSRLPYAPAIAPGRKRGRREGPLDQSPDWESWVALCGNREFYTKTLLACMPKSAAEGLVEFISQNKENKRLFNLFLIAIDMKGGSLPALLSATLFHARNSCSIDNELLHHFVSVSKNAQNTRWVLAFLSPGNALSKPEFVNPSPVPFTEKVDYLEQAVLAGNAAAVVALIKYIIHPDGQYSHSKSPLIVAMKHDNPEMVKLLLDHGASIQDARAYNLFNENPQSILNTAQQCEKYLRLFAGQREDQIKPHLRVIDCLYKRDFTSARDLLSASTTFKKIRLEDAYMVLRFLFDCVGLYPRAPIMDVVKQLSMAMDIKESSEPFTFGHVHVMDTHPACALLRLCVTNPYFTPQDNLTLTLVPFLFNKQKLLSGEQLPDNTIDVIPFGKARGHVTLDLAWLEAGICKQYFSEKNLAGSMSWLALLAKIPFSELIKPGRLLSVRKSKEEWALWITLPTKKNVKIVSMWGLSLALRKRSAWHKLLNSPATRCNLWRINCFLSQVTPRGNGIAGHARSQWRRRIFDFAVGTPPPFHGSYSPKI